MARDYFPQFVEENLQTFRVGLISLCGYDAIINALIFISLVSLDKTVAGDGDTRVNPKDQHNGLFVFHRLNGFVRDLQIGVDVLDVIQFFQVFDGLHHFDGFFRIQGDRLLW